MYTYMDFDIHRALTRQSVYISPVPFVTGSHNGRYQRFVAALHEIEDNASKPCYVQEILYLKQKRIYIYIVVCDGS